jgi:DNA-binding LacI/PurR family transcriptional regulator
MKAYLKEAPPPPALFAATDAIALGAMLALWERGLRPGKDVLVAGHDDLPFSAFTNPPLTTVRQPKEEIGRRAVETALDLPARPRNYVRKVLAPELVIRASSNPGFRSRP